MTDAAAPGPLHDELKGHFGGRILGGRLDPPFEVIEVQADAILHVASYLKASRKFDALMDLTAVDYRGYRSAAMPARFELVYFLRSFATGARIRLTVRVPDAEPPVPSLTPLYGSADWLEREVWDMYGLRFSGHPDLKRILMYEEFSGHPLRKDYPLLKQQPRVAQAFPGSPPFGERPDALEEAAGS